jgi:hypothetical protein
VIGDVLEGDEIVSSMYQFNGAETPMVSIFGIQVSGNHYIRSAGRMIRADRHPAAVPAPSYSRIWCLGTSRNTIPVRNSLGRTEEFADYEESEDPGVIVSTQQLAETLLNGPRAKPGPPVENYSLGIDPFALVLMGNGHWKPLSEVEIGDVLAPDQNVVSAIVAEFCNQCCCSADGLIVSKAQLVEDNAIWVRATHMYPSMRGPTGHGFILRNLFVSKGLFIVRPAGGTRLYRVRDYREVDDPSMQTAYDEALANKKGDIVLPFAAHIR